MFFIYNLNLKKYTFQAANKIILLADSFQKKINKSN